MEHTLRIDSFDLEKMGAYKSLNGRYYVPVVIGKVGLGLEYSSVNQDGQFVSHTEKVSEEGLFNRNYIDSCKGAPVCLAHPPSGTYSGNKDGLLVGHLDSRYKRDVADDTLVFMASVDDARAVGLMDQMIESGKAPQGSPCYTVKCLIRHQDHLEQIRAINDHYAFPLCRGEGRGGDDIGMRFDSNANIQISAPSKLWIFTPRQDTHKPKPVRNMNEKDTNTNNSPPPILEVRHADGMIYPIPMGGIRKDEQVVLVDLRTRHDAYEKELSQLRADKKELTDKAESLEKELETAKSDLQGVEEQADQLESENNQLKQNQSNSESNSDSSAIAAQVNQEVSDRIAILQELQPALDAKGFKSDSPLHQKSSPELVKLYLTEIYNPVRNDSDRVLDEELRADTADDEAVVYDSEKAMKVWRLVKPSTLNPQGTTTPVASEANAANSDQQARQDAINKTNQQFSGLTGTESVINSPEVNEIMRFDVSTDAGFEACRQREIDQTKDTNGKLVNKVR
jgi:regulator of replication initiation timing